MINEHIFIFNHVKLQYLECILMNFCGISFGLSLYEPICGSCLLDRVLLLLLLSQPYYLTLVVFCDHDAENCGFTLDVVR